ncbi:MAG TPA: ATP-binding domain-containing protein [Nocardioidaceae bacterium]|nr:ATP-binding domain-containing protein [Nocardioidaceae bacterium]
MPPDIELAAARPEIRREQTHLEESRAALHRMRERTAAMSALAGDRFSGEYLKFTLWKRMKALEDDPEVPLFFGRLDYANAEQFYIGRRHVTDEAGDPLVVDWRAPISRPFYRASRTEPLGVRLRRRFGFQHGALTAYEDEALADGGFDVVVRAEPEDAPHSDLLEAEIERPRSGPMRDIVATIQPEQDDIVRADLATSVCVQGAPGTGKTAVGLHRAAYLLYSHREQLNRQGVLVVGPNDAFLRYIGDVLPALGEIDARQTTVDDLVGILRIKAVDSPAAARVKGDARMAEVLSRAVWSHIQPASEGLVVPRGARRWRVPAYEADALVTELRGRGVRYLTGRGMLAQRLAHTVLVKMELAGESPDDRVQDAVARSRPVKQQVDALWPTVDPVRLLMRLLGDREFLAQSADGVLTADEQAAIAWTRAPKGPASAPWTLHDAVLVDEARDLLERTPSLGHVVLDEAQDLSAMMLRSVGRRCSTGSATILGDLAQATTPWSVGDWAIALGHLGQPEAHVEELTLGFRVPADVIAYAARLLPTIAPTLAPPTSVRRSAGDLSFELADEVLAAAASSVESAMGREGSIGVIVADDDADAMSAALDAAGIAHSVVGAEDDMEAHVDVVPATLAKGLEFDHVVLVEPVAIAAAEPDEVTGLRRLYVCLTRAVTTLVVVHSRPLPSQLTT